MSTTETRAIRGMVRSILTCSSTPIVFTLESGYDLESLAECVSITVAEMIKAA